MSTPESTPTKDLAASIARAGAHSTETAVKAKNLRKVFSPSKGPLVTALDDINLSIPRGRLTALVGPDGAGKTTLMRLLAGLMTKTSGELFVLGRDVAKEAQEVQSLLSYMPQKFGLYEDLSVEENMRLYADLHDIPAAARPAHFERLLHMTGLAPFTKRLAGKLSGGMKQKLGLACTLVRTPDLLLLDEPTVGVDPLSRRELWEILQEETKTGGLTVFVSTAYLEEAALCEKVCVLNHGRLLAEGTPEELCRLAHGRCFAVRPPDGMPTRLLQSRLLAEDAIADASPVGKHVYFTTEKNPADIRLFEELGLTSKPVRERLEDAFMLLLGKGAQQPPSLVKAEAIGKALQSGISPQKGPVIIEVHDLVKKFGDFTAVAHTSFQVHEGEVFGLLGPNGAGKTTTFRMLCGLLPATSGSLRVAGVDLAKARTEARAQIGYVAQKFSLYENLTVFENLRFFGGVYGLARKELQQRIEEVLEEFQLVERRDNRAGALPGGYKERLSMAAALIHRPRILFLDEPTSGIDPLARRLFWQKISLLAASGTTVIITTHFMEEAEYCDRIMIQDQGRPLILGSTAEIRAELSMPEADMNEIFIRIVEKARA